MTKLIRANFVVIVLVLLVPSTLFASSISWTEINEANYSVSINKDTYAPGENIYFNRSITAIYPVSLYDFPSINAIVEGKLFNIAMAGLWGGQIVTTVYSDLVWDFTTCFCLTSPTAPLTPGSYNITLKGIVESITGGPGVLLPYTVAAPAPTASIITPTNNVSVAQGTAVVFSGTGVASGGIPAGVMTTYNVGGVIYPSGIAFDGTNMWVSSNINAFRVAKISPTGATTPYLSTTNGALPVGIAFDGTNMWVAGYVNDNVTKVSPSGVMTDYPGTGAGPWGIAFDGANMWTVNDGYDYWLNDYGPSSVTKISPTGVMTTYYGLGFLSEGIAFDGTNMWTTSWGGNSVTKVSPTGVMTTYPGTGAGPYGIAFDGTNMWTANYNNNSVTKISPAGVMTTYLGTGSKPTGIAFDGTNMWTANWGNNSVTRISPAGVMTTYPGTGANPNHIAFDGTNMWTANASDNTTTKVSTGGNSITAYEWREGNCSTGTLLSTASFFNLATPSVSAGRTIYFRVKDSNNAWSTCESRVITVTPPSDSDLIAGAVTPVTPTAGTPGTFSATISNTGTGSTGADFSNFFQVATAINGGGTITDLAPVGMAALGISASLPASSPLYTFTTSGTYSVRACTDKTSSAGGGVIAESDENNNCSASWTTVAVSPANTAPTISTPTISSITATGATLGANVTSLGIPASISARGTCFGTTPAPTTNCVAQGGVTTGIFTQARTGMIAGTTYYYRGYATNTTGTGYSADGMFTTSAAAINGTCGSSNLNTFSTAPTTNLCSAGTATAVLGAATGPWSWSCNGVNGGTNTTCSAFTNVISGSCGTANGTPTPTKPTTNLCSIGTASSVTGPGPWNWDCTGLNGGAIVSCNAPKSTSCGNNTCDTGETILTCPKDCKAKYQQF